MRAKHERFPDQLGAYLLGELAGEEQRAFRAHLETCPICQAEAAELEPVVAALAEARPNDVEEEAPELPADLEERTFASIEQEARARDAVGRRRRWRLTSRPALAAAAALLLVVAGLALYPVLFAPEEVPIEPVSFSETAPGIEAEGSLISHTWGTEVRLVASGLKGGQTYEVALLSEDGNRVPSGTFIGTSDRPVECNLNAALLRPDVAALEVRGAGDELLLYADLPEQARGSSQAGVFPSWVELALWGNAAEAQENELVEIPEVESLPVGEAEEKLREARFGTETVRKESRTEEDGKVLDQSPSGGEKLREGAHVVLTVGEAPAEAGEEPEQGADSWQDDDPEAPTAPGVPGDGAEAPLQPPPPAAGEGGESEVVPPSPAPAPAPPPAVPYSPEPLPPSGEQEEPDYYEQPTEEQYPAEPPPSYEQQPEQPYPEGDGGGYAPEDPGHADQGPEADDGGTEDPGSSSYGSPDSGISDYGDRGSGEGRDSGRSGDSGYGGSGY